MDFSKHVMSIVAKINVNHNEGAITGTSAPPFEIVTPSGANYLRYLSATNSAEFPKYNKLKRHRVKRPIRFRGALCASVVVLLLLCGLGQPRALNDDTESPGPDSIPVYTPPRAFSPRVPPTPGVPIRDPDMEWVESQLAGMSLDEKIGQLIVSSDHVNGESLVTSYKVGGFVFLGNSQNAADIVASVNRLQNFSPRPLWFSIDSEAGLGARVADATIFPMMMAFGAADAPELSELCGRITARESQALGIQVAYGPDVDVNTEPVNPIISTRSMAGEPEIVARLARRFIEGARAEGALCTLKHYPGHGATQGDSHSSLPGVDLPLSEIEATHIAPYRSLIGTNSIDLIMTAHVWYSQVHPGTPWPATLSSIFNKDILRTDMGYQGILISDAYTMQGLVIAVPDEGERAVVGLENGIDVILAPADAGAVHTAIKNAVNTSRVLPTRIDESVRRVLSAKSRAGLPERKLVDPNGWQSVLNHPDHQALVRSVSERAFTCMKNDLETTPTINRSDKVLLLSLNASQRIFYRFDSSSFRTPFLAEVPDTTVVTVSTNVTTNSHNNIIAQAALTDKILVLGYDWYKIASTSQVTLINDLAALNKPVIYVGFGAPYHFLQIPDVDACYCGYASVPAMQQVAVDVLLGDREAIGIIPVELPGVEPFVRNEGLLTY